MLNNRFRILWFKLQREENPHLYLSFPISLYVFQELLDCIMDLLELACFFVPKRTNMNSSSPFSVYTVKELVQMMISLFDAITEGEPYDLVDVTADKIKISIKIK
jgi:hypothetical protein